MEPTTTDPRPHTPAVSRSPAASVVMSAPTLSALTVAAAVAIWVGTLIGERTSPGPTRTATPTPSVATVDAEGTDVADLPRFADAVRVSYASEMQGSSIVTTVEYLVRAELDDVRGFYRRAFREHAWELVELDFVGGEWVFLISKGARVALLEIEPRGTSVAVEIELAEPSPSASAVPATAAPTPTPVPPPPPPPPPVPGDDEDDDDDGLDD